MHSHPHEDWRFGLWSTLSLELLARAALSTFSPVLVADPRDWNNLLYALEIEPKAQKFIPKSVEISTVFHRLQELLSEFTPELADFCQTHLSRRNDELHTGTTPFVSTSVSRWLPNYYRASSILLAAVGENLEVFLGGEAATVASTMIEAASDESAKAIAKSIGAYKLVWEGKSEQEQDRLAGLSSTWATRQDGHRVLCPACGCGALVSGSAIAAPIKSINEDEITETQQYLPSKFECVACGLKISGFSQLSAAGVGNAYNATFTYDAADYYASHDDYQGYEPDFNEPDNF